MPKPRRSGGSVSMRSSSRRIVPPESGSNPAMQLSAVDLPQPDGPSSAMNSPRRTVSVRSFSALNALPAAPAKRRVTRSRRSSLKSCFIDVLDLEFPHPLDALRLTPSPRMRGEGRGEATPALLRLRRPDLLVPDPEHLDLRLRFERLRVRELLQPLVVLGPAELADPILAFLRRHRHRHVLHVRTRM